MMGVALLRVVVGYLILHKVDLVLIFVDGFLEGRSPDLGEIEFGEIFATFLEKGRPVLGVETAVQSSLSVG